MLWQISGGGGYSMNEDAKALALLIESAPGITPNELSARLGVSVRTVRSRVHQANEVLAGDAEIALSRNSGYRLIVHDSDAFASRFQSSDAFAPEVPQLPQDRVRYLINDLLMRSDWVTIDELCEVLFVSRSTITSDLKQVEGVIAPYDLTLEKRPHYGIRVAGSEFSRRLCLANIIIDDMSEQPYRTSDACNADIAELIASAGLSSKNQDGFQRPSRVLEDISDCVMRVAKEEDFTINPAAYQSLLVHIAVALMRIREDCYVPMATEYMQLLHGKREYQVAERIAAAVSQAFDVELPEEEIGYIAIHLAGKRVMADAELMDTGDSATPDMLGDGVAAQGVVISDEIWKLVSDMLDGVWKAYRFDFRNDLELRMMLARHLIPLSVRLRYRMKLKNPLLADIKVRYPLAYFMAGDASAVIAEAVGAEMSEDETGYIALSFALALEHQKEAASKHNILVVCASGAGSARLLEYRCRREFGDYIDRIYTCDLMGLDSFDLSRIDYVFTTVPIERSLPVPVLEVGCFFDETDIPSVREALSSTNNGRLPYFKRSLFFPHMQQRNKQEVLDYLLDRVDEQEQMAPNFRELVWKREGLIPTSFGNRVAMPHPIDVSSDTTFMVVGLLDKPVIWDQNGREVQVVILAVFAREYEPGFHGFLDRFTDMLMSPAAIDALVARQDWPTFARIITDGPPKG